MRARIGEWAVIASVILLGLVICWCGLLASGAR